MQKKIILIILAGVIALNITGCVSKTGETSGTDVTIEATESVKPIKNDDLSVSITATETVDIEKTAEIKEEVDIKNTKPVSPTKTPVPEVTKEPVNTKVKNVIEGSEEAIPAITETPIQAVSENEEILSTQVPVTTQAPITTLSPTPEAKQCATSADCNAIADKVIEYINSYRGNAMIKLYGLTEYARYRSRQLVNNFSHDTSDERAAATALQYGTYIDTSLYGLEGEPYYVSGAREAIVMSGYTGTIDEVAKYLVELVRSSSSHWSYVGSSEYKYIAVGITYESGIWYCDIAVAIENTDNN